LAASNTAFWAGRFTEAEELARQALEGAKEPNEFRGNCLVSLGAALAKLDRHADATQPFTEALAIYEKLYGPLNPRIANAAGWLGSCAKARGEFETAEAYFRRSLEINEKVDGPNSSSVAHNYNNLGNLALARRTLAEAEEFHRKALAIREKVHGKDHSLVALSLHNLGIVCREAGRPKEAEELGLRAVETYRKTNPDHGELALPLQMLTGLCGQQKRWPEAERHAREWLRVLEKGKIEGPSMVAALDGLATALTATGRADEAAAVGKWKQDLQDKLAGKKP
jgi:tetratricopeptide (TPR) repeat protein